MTPFTIRPATRDDVPAIARVHIESWRTTYAGLLPDDLLANLSVERRERGWNNYFDAADSRDCLFVAEVDRQIVGFANGGEERQGNPDYRGELNAIYLLQAYQGQGIGRALVRPIVQHLVDQGYTTMLIWVVAGNPACRFYEALGGKPVDTRTESIGSQAVEEIAYGYDALTPLLA